LGRATLIDAMYCTPLGRATLIDAMYCTPLGRATLIDAKLLLWHVGVEPEHGLSTLAPMAKEEIAVLTNDTILWGGGRLLRPQPTHKCKINTYKLRAT
jgi:hypothetical protein